MPLHTLYIRIRLYTTLSIPCLLPPPPPPFLVMIFAFIYLIFFRFLLQFFFVPTIEKPTIVCINTMPFKDSMKYSFLVYVRQCVYTPETLAAYEECVKGISSLFFLCSFSLTLHVHFHLIHLSTNSRSTQPICRCMRVCVHIFIAAPDVFFSFLAK